MKPLLFLAADYANITGDGKLNVMGIFNDIFSFNFPARHSSMHLVGKLGAELGEYGQTRNFTIKLLDEDGNHDVVKHPKFPQLRATLPRHRQLAKGYVEFAVKLVDRLLELQKESEG